MRIVIAEDSVLLRDGLTRLLRSRPRGRRDGRRRGALLAVVAREHPEVAIVDVRMPPTFTDEGVRAALELRERSPELAVLVLSQYVEERYAGELLAGDARGVGYLLKDSVAETRDFLEAIDRIAAGGKRSTPRSSASSSPAARRGDPLDDLSPREREVLSLMAEGRSNARDRRPALRHRACRREARPLDLREARPAPGRGRPSPRARGAPLSRGGASGDVAALPQLERAQAPEPVAVVGARCSCARRRRRSSWRSLEEPAVRATEEQVRGGLAQLPRGTSGRAGRRTPSWRDPRSPGAGRRRRPA